MVIGQRDRNQHCCGCPGGQASRGTQSEGVENLLLPRPGPTSAPHKEKGAFQAAVFMGEHDQMCWCRPRKNDISTSISPLHGGGGRTRPSAQVCPAPSRAEVLPVRCPQRPALCKQNPVFTTSRWLPGSAGSTWDQRRAPAGSRHRASAPSPTPPELPLEARKLRLQWGFGGFWKVKAS